MEGNVKIFRTILFSILIASLALAWGLPTAQVSAAVQPEGQFSQTLAGAPYMVMASFIVNSIPVLLVFLFCQKIILRGIILPQMK